MIHRKLSIAALFLFLAAFATPVLAEPTAGPPLWADEGASVYLGMKPQAELQTKPPGVQHAAPQEDRATHSSVERYSATSPAAEQTDLEIAAYEPAQDLQPRVVDANVTLASHEAVAPAAKDEETRRLAPPSKDAYSGSAKLPAAADTSQIAAARRIGELGLPMRSLYTIGSALTIVIGAFLLFAWAVRRGSGKTQSLPTEVVSVLGRVPLAARQFAELLRVGNRLVLVSLTPTGAETLTEVTDPAEVDRLVGLCQQFAPQSTTKAFDQVFRQLSREPAPPGFLGNESLAESISSAAAAYRTHRGEHARG
jgi:flagellar biogenesis protein FliO